MAPETSTSVFGRRPSLFSGKKRKEGNSSAATPISPLVSEEQPSTSPLDRRGSSVVSLSSSANDNLHRSSSLRSHESQASLSRHKSRAPSIANIASRSPIRLHRVSRSISANAVSQKFGSFSSAISPQQSHESVSELSPQDRPRDHNTTSTSLDPASKTSFSMLVAPFGHGVKRQDTDRTTFSSKPSISSESGSAVLTSGSAGALNPVVIFHSISETVNKRMATLDYLRKVHEGHMHYFNTLHFTPANLAHIPSLMPSKLSRRATSYLTLGISLPPLLDLSSGSALEYLRALNAILSEFETYQQLNSDGGAGGARGRVGQMFKSGMRGVRTGRRSSAVADGSFMDADYSTSNTAADSASLHMMASYTHHQEFSYLQTPSLPFDPDFNTSFATLTDILVDTYDGLMQLLPGPESCNPAVLETFHKADKMLRKILMQNVVQELGDYTRREVKSEVAGLGKVALSGLM